MRAQQVGLIPPCCMPKPQIRTALTCGWNTRYRQRFRAILLHGLVQSQPISMPAKATLFNHRAEPVYELGSAARNHVKYSPSGRFFLIGGFGNVQGDMDIWERKGFKKIATVNASNSSLIEWSPDGRYILTAILYKRLKVDNSIKLWHYSGVLAHKVETKEMYQVGWRPEAANLWPDKSSSSPVPKSIAVETTTEVKKPAGKYVPPGMRHAQNSPSLYVN